jgi:hypothetical protein
VVVVVGAAVVEGVSPDCDVSVVGDVVEVVTAASATSPGAGESSRVRRNTASPRMNPAATIKIT